MTRLPKLAVGLALLALTPALSGCAYLSRDLTLHVAIHNARHEPVTVDLSFWGPDGNASAFEESFDVPANTSHSRGWINLTIQRGTYTVVARVGDVVGESRQRFWPPDDGLGVIIGEEEIQFRRTG